MSEHEAPSGGILAWHWLREDGCMRDGTRVVAGETYRVAGPLVMCEHGLHASEAALHALRHAPGPIICRVRMGGDVLRAADVLCATERTVLWMADAGRTLHEFALVCAQDALERERAAGREPDPRSWAALETKRQWLDGGASDAALDAAGAAAWAAAWGTPLDAAGAAAWAAAWGTPLDAAGAAAWAAALGTPLDAAWAAAGAAARDAAGAAAWAAARATQETELTRQLTALAKCGGRGAE